MQLERRLTAAMLAALALLLACFAGLGWLQDQLGAQRYVDALLKSQRIAWDKLQHENLNALERLAQGLLAQPALQDLSSPGAQRRLEGVLSAQALALPGLRIDIVSPKGALWATSARTLDPQPLAEAGWLVDTAASQRQVRGLSQVAPQQYDWVLVQGFAGGSLVLGLDVGPRMDELAAALGGQLFLGDMRGIEVVGTAPGLLRRTGALVPVRTPHAQLVRMEEASAQLMRLVSQPVFNPDQRVAGVLVWVQDATQEIGAERQLRWLILAGAAVITLALALGLRMYVQHAMAPMGRSVGVLRALAAGSTEAALDDADEESADESGAIARDIVALRGELIHLETLRQERVRLSRQQERLIRDQLRALADSLEPGSRTEILAALGSTAEAAPGSALVLAGEAEASGNQLAHLAVILGRMSGLVSNQQNRLLKLLRDLQAAMKTEAMLASLQQELEIARQMQQSILPRAALARREVDIAATMIAAKEIGGDFYDYFLIDPDHLAIVVADVSGKGVPAAFFMAISRTLLKSHVMFLREPGAAMSALNDQLCVENEQMMFVTVFLGVLDLRSGDLRFVNAGHNPPVRMQRHQASYFPSGTNMALAVLEGQNYVEGSTRLAPGETVLMYTDGVTEACNAAGQFYGEAALLQLLSAWPLQSVEGTVALPAQVVDAVHRFEDGAAQSDDITVVALTYHGGGGA